VHLLDQFLVVQFAENEIVVVGHDGTIPRSARRRW